MITGFYTALLGLILLWLMYVVIYKRMKYKVGLGDGGIRDMEQSIRAHANFVEVVPFLLIIMFLLETQGMYPWFLHFFGSTLILARVIHALGLYSSPYRSKGRVTGIVICQILMLAGITLLLWGYLFPKIGG